MSFEISVIVPVRNEELSIRRVLKALLHQTTEPQEIIIADGGSTDQTKQIVKDFMSRAPCIRLVEDDDAYPGRGRNLAIQAARNEWVAMTDAGSLVAPDWLATFKREAGSGDEADVILGSYEPILSTFLQECLALSYIAPPNPVGDRYTRAPSTISMMLKKEVWRKLGRFPEHLRAGEDLLFFDKLSASRFVVKHAPGALVRWNIPTDLGSVFRRFRIYSLHTLKAGLGKQWHLALARMYLVGFLFLALAIFHHLGWLSVALLGLIARVHKSIRARRRSLNLTHRIGPRTYFMVAIVILWIDIAAFIGAFDYTLSRKTVSRGNDQ